MHSNTTYGKDFTCTQDVDHDYGAIAQGIPNTTMLWDIGAQSTLISEDLLSDAFRNYFSQPEHDHYRNDDATRVQIEVRNVEIELVVIGYVIPREQMPNQSSIIIFGQRQCIPRSILVAKGEDIAEDIWGDLVVYEYIDEFIDLILARGL
ncbi:hypothetical protein VE03_01391 [Pseudogymnoascus sp. 23342-1-I1]|nr:hypothetical protein VE03_01391 [Pseudogymnoascus sp. 23342-1-I1]